MTDWKPGDLAQCIVRSWGRHKPCPIFMQIYTVTGAEAPGGTLYLALAELPGPRMRPVFWRATGFVKVPPLEEEPDHQLVVDAYRKQKTPALV